ncbi:MULTISPECIES: hypothetical protein [unclassified Enterococcus]|uniref:hypothetical protein n=1 Tax=unclassified Enterococcus TaxID=2608891 RepID=UPI001553E561|nr:MULTISPECIES: hypothetical protein [unclassified Enterococcus]MBS7576976.1 hypothetical protein [Enterococcus sp. MMGLQ5-2]MBS7584383.1 hypothetical protein [Enterococcus sp. MMGLQ5-1]NPD12238.1 hypothetical protein [Enterococcus sp. MMGLQ5-1]NPD36810.1 hypothetical protein [Enterococcus sp. MMGLQ5-2]
MREIQKDSYYNKHELADHYSIHVKTIERFMTEMRQINDYKLYFRRPSHKTSVVQYGAFDRFLLYREDCNNKKKAVIK